MTQAKCKRCNYEWTPRQDPDKVKECPSCKTYRWKEPRPEPEKTQ